MFAMLWIINFYITLISLRQEISTNINPGYAKSYVFWCSYIKHNKLDFVGLGNGNV